jgi:hypothetical protein
VSAQNPRRRQGVAAPGSAVVSIRAHSGYRPDYARLAGGQVSAAREKLGHTPEQFADYLSGILGWSIRPYAVKRWESGDAPPGDVLLACGTDTPAVSLLAVVPPSFPVEALIGPWVTCYQFTHDGKAKFHADIANVTLGLDGCIRAVNHPPEPRSEGRARPFRNEISARLTGRHLIGEWMNTSDTRYYGTLQLAVLPGEIVMEGYYAGVGSDVEVSTGFWKWVRIDPDSVPDAGPGGVILRDPAAVHDRVMSHSQYGEPLTLADVREET